MNKSEFRASSSQKRADKNNTGAIKLAFGNRRNNRLKRAHKNKMNFLYSIHLEIADKVDRNRKMFEKYEAKPENDVIPVLRGANRRKTDFVKRPQNGDFYSCHAGFAVIDSEKGELCFPKEKKEVEIDNPLYSGV